MKRIRFTRDELEIINDMAAIASAANWGEGDYADWNEARSKPYDSLREKVWELISRADEPDNARRQRIPLSPADLQRRVSVRPREYSDLTGTPLPTVYKYIASGHIKSSRVGSTIRIPVSEIR